MSRIRDAIVYLLFFLSGASALVYEISWSRQIGIYFGHTARGAAVVLAAYFAGMAVGYLAAARWAGRFRPLAAYGVAECIAAVWVLIFPLLLKGIEANGSILSPAGASPDLLAAIRAVVLFVLLLPATAALGATLPLMAEYLADNRDRPAPRSRIARAYALNTLGATVGVVLATFVLLVSVGVTRCSYLAAAVASLCGLLAISLSRPSGRLSPADAILVEPTSTVQQQPTRENILWIVVAAASGFGTLGLEVLYTRMFSLVFHNSTYTFGAVVAVFLVSLALGAAVADRLVRRWRPASIAACCCLAGSLAIVASAYLFITITELGYYKGTLWFLEKKPLLQDNPFLEYLLGAHLMVASVTLAPIALLGIVLPIAWHAGREKSGGIPDAKIVGRLTAANTLAAASGSLAASFVLLPLVGLWNALLLMALLFALVGLALLPLRKRMVVVAPLAGILLGGGVLVHRSADIALDSAWKGAERVFQREGAYGWIDVIRMDIGSRSHLKLKQNVHYGMGSDGASTQREYRQAHLPFLLHANPRQVAFLGLGTGLTVAPVVVHEEVTSAVVVELIPEVVEAARCFHEANLNVVDHPKVEMRIDDARHFLLTTDQQFDVIVSDLFVPWESKTGYLYTVEQYHAAQKRLRPGGIYCQWLPMYQMGAEQFDLIANSMADEFPYVTLWWGRLSRKTPMIALVGSNEPLRLDGEAIDARLARLGETTLGPSDPYLGSHTTLARLYVGRWHPQEDQPRNTDEHPWVEFRAPIAHRNNTRLQYDRLLRYTERFYQELSEEGVSMESQDEKIPPPEVRRAWQRRKLQE